MDSKILLGRIIQRLIDRGYAQVSGYNRFNFMKLTTNSIVVDRENGEDTDIYFDKILVAIDGYKMKPEFYNEGPGKLREFGLTHVTSPIWAMLHLLKKNDFLNN